MHHQILIFFAQLIDDIRKLIWINGHPTALADAQSF